MTAGVIRPAVEGDIPHLVDMIRELAEYENLLHQVTITEEDLARTLFAPDAVVFDSVVEDGSGGLAAHALWYRTFSTFLGRTGIWLEDLYVRPEHRRKGYASRAAHPSADDHRWPARVGGARVERPGHGLLPAPGGPADGRLDPVPLVYGIGVVVEPPGLG